MPEAIRNEDPGGAPDVGSPPLPRLKRQWSSFFTTGLSLVAVVGLVLSAGRGVQTPLDPPPATPITQELGAADVSPSDVAEIEEPPAGTDGDRPGWTRPQRTKGKTRHVTLSFGATSSSEGSRDGTSSRTSGSARSSDPKPRSEKRPDKVEEVQAELAVATTELIHIHKIGTGEHFYSIDRAECERRYQDGYIYKGVIGLVFDRQVEGTVPLRTDDGIAAYIWRDAGDDRWPVHYFRGPGSEQKRDYFTTSETDRQDYIARGWTYLGIVGYVSAR